MPRGKPCLIYAALEHVDPAKVTPAHDLTDPPAAFELAVALKGEDWPFPPLLLYRKRRKLYGLDGHHRRHASLLRARPTTPAYVLPWPQLKRVLARHFAGLMPDELWLLDSFIVLPDGSMYSDARIR